MRAGSSLVRSAVTLTERADLAATLRPRPGGPRESVTLPWCSRPVRGGGGGRRAPDQQLAYLEAAQLPTFIGQRAAHDVAAGMLVSATVAVEQMVPSAGRTVMGMSLPLGAEPAIELLVGGWVRVILSNRPRHARRTTALICVSSRMRVGRAAQYGR